jgi:hypothetical protein
MFTVKELMLSPDGTVAELLDVADAEADDDAEVADAAGVVVDDELDDEQPAAASETSAALSPTQPSVRKPPIVRLPSEWEDRPPPVLIPSPIPNIPSVERVYLSRCGTTYRTSVPSRRKHSP